ncbi:hypothetical protein WBS46_16725 [Bacillus albus]|uniref:hypothetical protein n=1 Tax=Bacillus albus TaxID=2026189 RepID=UPI001009B94D|nr:hypothetical protein [Bacillus albus]RXJ19876.1 hypothetical protein ETJ91_00470 [Bacillus albus]RXJ30047.1 hypothetical protein ETJ76_15620 [Bacillus albus]RXJ31639.1 hypothetical protein ETJ90_08395 [Bacillus albus]RXJ42863.1 hypothetical protein ETJ89_08400 [Bacillus albus]RXJ59791.1 hypothetical protein ETJ66_08395 [Bacillus albus]
MDLLLSAVQAANDTIPPAVEAAKLTISNASENAKMAAYVAFGTAIISFGATMVSTNKARKSAKEAAAISKDIADGNLNSLEKRRLIDTVSTQRIEWINNVRNQFVEFNALCHTFSMTMVNKKSKGEPVVIDMIDYLNIEKAKNQIELFLNPREVVVEKLIKYLKQMFDCIVKEPENVPKYSNIRANVIFLQQVVLKAEWKRIKLETQKGEQLSNSETDEIFKEVALEMDSKRYREIFS